MVSVSKVGQVAFTASLQHHPLAEMMGDLCRLVWGIISNELQNFLYLSRDFDTSHVGEGEGQASPGRTKRRAFLDHY